MYMGEELQIFPWFSIHFTENNGMAFGLELGGQGGKIFLSIFRILASAGIGWYLWHLVKQKAHPGLITCFALIFAGAIGNIIDSAFYGLIFSESYDGAAVFMPAGGGYASILHGKVVDMLYFPILHGQFPTWVPMWGGENFLFFRPVFNIADSSITVGVILFLLFQKKYVRHHADKEVTNDVVAPDQPANAS